MTDAEALARLLAWIGRDPRRTVKLGLVWVKLEYPVTVAGDTHQYGHGSTMGEAVEDALARAEG